MILQIYQFWHEQAGKIKNERVKTSKIETRVSDQSNKSFDKFCIGCYYIKTVIVKLQRL